MSRDWAATPQDVLHRWLPLLPIEGILASRLACKPWRMAAGAVVRHITWDLRQSRMCAQLCSARGLQYVTGLSDLSTEGARRQLQVMQREYPSIQQLHVVLDETLPQQLLDDLPGLIAAYVDCEVVVLEWGTFRHLDPHYLTTVGPEDRALPARAPEGWLVPLGRYPGVVMRGQKWTHPTSTAQIRALVDAAADRPQLLVQLTSSDGRPLPPWPRPAPAPPSRPRTPHPLLTLRLCHLPLGFPEAGYEVAGRWRGVNACKWDGEEAKGMLRQQQQLQVLRHDTWSPGLFCALKGLRALDVHHFIVSSTEAEAAVEAPLPPALQHLTLHCDLSEHGIGDWQFWPRTFSSLSPLPSLRSLTLAGLKPAHVNLLQMASVTCLTRLELMCVLSSPAGRALVDGYQRLVCDCTLEYVLNRLPLLVTLQLVAPGVLYGFGIREPARVWAALPRLQVLALEGVHLNLLPRTVYTELHSHGGEHNRHITKAIRQQWPGQAVANAIQGAIGRDSVSRYQRWHNPVSCWTAADLEGDALVAPGHTPGDDDAMTPANAEREKQLRALEQQRRREAAGTSQQQQQQQRQLGPQDPLYEADWGPCQHRAGCMRMDLPLWLLPRNLRWLSLARYSLVLPPVPPPGLFDRPAGAGTDAAAAAPAAAGGAVAVAGEGTLKTGLAGAASNSSSSKAARAVPPAAPGTLPGSSHTAAAAAGEGAAAAGGGGVAVQGGGADCGSAAGRVPTVGDLLGHELRGLALKDCLIVRPQLVPAQAPDSQGPPTTPGAATAATAAAAGGSSGSGGGSSSAQRAAALGSSCGSSSARSNSRSTGAALLQGGVTGGTGGVTGVTPHPQQNFPVQLAPIRGLGCWVSTAAFLQQLGPQPHLHTLRLIGMPVTNTDVPAVAAYGASLRELSLALAPQELPCDDGKAELWYDRFKGTLPQPKYHGAGCLTKAGLDALVAGLAAASAGGAAAAAAAAGGGGGSIGGGSSGHPTTTASSSGSRGDRSQGEGSAGGSSSGSRRGGPYRRRRSRRPGGASAAEDGGTAAAAAGDAVSAAGGCGSDTAGVVASLPGGVVCSNGPRVDAVPPAAAPLPLSQASAAAAAAGGGKGGGVGGAAAVAPAAATAGGGAAAAAAADPREGPDWLAATGGSLAPPLRTLVLFGTRACLPLVDTGALLPLAALSHLTNLIIAVGPRMDVVDHTMVEVLWKGGRWQVVSGPDSLEKNQATLAPLYAGLPYMRHGRICLI